MPSSSGKTYFDMARKSNERDLIKREDEIFKEKANEALKKPSVSISSLNDRFKEFVRDEYQNRRAVIDPYFDISYIQSMEGRRRAIVNTVNPERLLEQSKEKIGQLEKQLQSKDKELKELQTQLKSATDELDKIGKPIGDS